MAAAAAHPCEAEGPARLCNFPFSYFKAGRIPSYNEFIKMCIDQFLFVVQELKRDVT
jgi:hypothetical protein